MIKVKAAVWLMITLLLLAAPPVWSQAKPPLVLSGDTEEGTVVTNGYWLLARVNVRLNPEHPAFPDRIRRSLTVTNAEGKVVKHYSWFSEAEVEEFRWEGKVPDGKYRVEFSLEDLAGGETLTYRRTVTVDSISRLEITRPGTDITVRDRQFTLRGLAEPGARLDVWLNSAVKNVTPAPDGSFELPLELKKGDNIIRVASIDPVDNRAEVKRIITYRPVGTIERLAGRLASFSLPARLGRPRWLPAIPVPVANAARIAFAVGVISWTLFRLYTSYPGEG